MKREIENLEFVTVDETGVIDFENYIIPSLYNQLISLETFEEEMIFVAGATLDDVPIAAIVAQLLETDQIYIHSIIVDEEYRNLGIGTDLLYTIIQIGEDILDPNPAKDGEFRIFVHTEYTLNGDSLEQFDNFLKKNGFRDFYDYMPLYIFNSKEIARIGKPAKKATPFSKIDRVSQDELEEFFNDQGIYPELNLSFYNGKANDPKCFLMVQNLEDGVYTVSSATENDDAVSSDLDELFCAAVNELNRMADDYRVVVNVEMNAFPELWKKYESLCETKSTHREAGLYISFER